MTSEKSRQSASLSIALRRDLRTGEWTVDNIHLKYGKVRNVTHFASPISYRDAFREEFCQLLEQNLPRTAAPQVVALSNHSVQVGSLMLSDLRMMAMQVVAGIQKVIVRFREVRGLVQDLFAQHHVGYLDTRVYVPISPPKAGMRSTSDNVVSGREVPLEV